VVWRGGHCGGSGSGSGSGSGGGINDGEHVSVCGHNDDEEIVGVFCSTQ